MGRSPNTTIGNMFISVKIIIMNDGVHFHKGNRQKNNSFGSKVLEILQGDSQAHFCTAG